MCMFISTNKYVLIPQYTLGQGSTHTHRFLRYILIVGDRREYGIVGIVDTIQYRTISTISYFLRLRMPTCLGIGTSFSFVLLFKQLTEKL